MSILREHGMRMGWAGMAILLPLVVGAMSFHVPNKEQRLQAIGTTAGLSPILQRAFGLAHCVYFRCVFNGSNHLAESDARPMHECPVDLRKLRHSLGFDVPRRYANLYRFHRKVGFEDEAVWTHQRLEYIIGQEEAGKLIETPDKGAKS